MTRLLAILAITLVSAVPAPDAHEPIWSAYLCKEMFGLEPVYGETVEVRTPDGARCDILTPDTAWEVEWCQSGKHWEAPSQATFYGRAFNRERGVILLMNGGPNEDKYYLRTQIVCTADAIPLVTVDVRQPPRGRR